MLGKGCGCNQSLTGLSDVKITWEGLQPFRLPSCASGVIRFIIGLPPDLNIQMDYLYPMGKPNDVLHKLEKQLEELSAKIDDERQELVRILLRPQEPRSSTEGIIQRQNISICILGNYMCCISSAKSLNRILRRRRKILTSCNDILLTKVVMGHVSYDSQNYISPL